MIYFKNRQEIDDFFKGEMFKFVFRSDAILSFETLEPILLGDEYFDFRVNFFDDKLKDFFCYSKFDNWLVQFKIFEVIKYPCGQRDEGDVLYVEMY